MKKYKITVKGRSGQIIQRGPDDSIIKLLLPPPQLNGIEDQVQLSEYIDIEGLSGGYITLKIIDEELYTISEYYSNIKFSEDELHDIKEETLGQWSDGAGEGFEQFPCILNNAAEIYVSPWNPKANITIKQELVDEEY